nr:S1 family peptidase [Micromonospora sp. DSM 115978]
MRRRTMTATALTAVAVLLLTAAAPPAASAAPAGPAAEPAAEYDGETLSFARERGITPDEAERRLGWQALAPDLAEGLDRDLKDRFGGVWIAVDRGDRVRIGVAGEVTGEIAEIVKRTAESVGLREGYDIGAVRNPLARLDEANDWLADGLEKVNADARVTLTAGVRTDLNAVELQVPPSSQLTEQQRALVVEARERLAGLLVLGDAVGNATPRACAYPYCDPPLRGGIRITHPNAGCTGAFIAKSKVDDKLYQFTAGHCAYQNYTNWSTRFTNNSVHVIGPVWTWWWYSGGDMAILRINNVPGWNPQPWVMVTSGPDTTANSTYPIKSDKTSVLGMRICTTGAYYGRSDCGYVTQLNVTATYGGVTVKHLGRGSFCGTGGDSGAPMYAKNVAYGLQVAGYSECDSLYQGIRAAETKLNVNVLHAP